MRRTTIEGARNSVVCIQPLEFFAVSPRGDGDGDEFRAARDRGLYCDAADRCGQLRGGVDGASLAAPGLARGHQGDRHRQAQ